MGKKRKFWGRECLRKNGKRGKKEEDNPIYQLKL
jgi:hypothetical protein